MKHCGKKQKYYLNIQEFIENIITIPTSNLNEESTNTSLYFAGRSPVYNAKTNKLCGYCSASFLCIETDNVVANISNYLSIENGLIVSWFTPSTPLNLEIDSIIHSMVTECIVKASTKIGFNPYYGDTFNMKVSSSNNKIYFKLHKIKSK